MEEVHDLHVWSLTPGIPLLCAHINLDVEAEPTEVLHAITRYCRCGVLRALHVLGLLGAGAGLVPCAPRARLEGASRFALRRAVSLLCQGIALAARAAAGRRWQGRLIGEGERKGGGMRSQQCCSAGSCVNALTACFSACPHTPSVAWARRSMGIEHSTVQLVVNGRVCPCITVPVDVETAHVH